jgi:hypothetical protein
LRAKLALGDLHEIQNGRHGSITQAFLRAQPSEECHPVSMDFTFFVFGNPPSPNPSDSAESFTVLKIVITAGTRAKPTRSKFFCWDD